MNNTLRKLWSIVSTVLVAAMVLCAVFLVGARIFGYHAFTVISGSMEPAYSVGDLLYVKAVDVHDIEVGDPITFVLNEELTVATHRVVGIDNANRCFYTKGDANAHEDSEPVYFDNVIGTPKFSVPLLGYVADFVQHSPGKYITLVVGAALIVAVFVPDMVRAARKGEKDPEGEE